MQNFSPMDRDGVMKALLSEVQAQINESLELMLGDAIKKGIVKVRESSPQLYAVNDAAIGSTKVKLEHSCTLDYLGAERIEELEKENAYLKKMNADLHNALGEFFQKSKPNQFLKRDT